MHVRALLFALLVLPLAACVGVNPEMQTNPSAPEDLASMRSVVLDRTVITHDIHGTQIEYHSPSGRAHLWYPGNFGGVPANWKVEVDRYGSQMCWQYPSSSRNGITGLSAGGKFQCQDMRRYQDNIVEILTGDPFALDSGRVPFRLPKGKHFAADLAKMAKINLSTIRYAYRKAK